MQSSPSLLERLLSVLVYLVTCAATVMVTGYVVGGGFAPLYLSAFTAAIALLLLAALRLSRYALTHAIHALLLHALTWLLATLPPLLVWLQAHGILAPFLAKGRYEGLTIDPGWIVLFGLGGALGLFLIFIAYESLFDAVKGQFLAHWPLVEAIRRRVMPEPESRRQPRQA
jgi:hypothetical protein